MTDKVGYLALPGVSFTSLIINLPYLADADGRTPVIVIDSHDYTRFRGWTTRERTKQKTQFLGMVYEDLRRRNLLQLVDYSNYYPNEVQDSLRKYREKFTSLSGDINQRAANSAVNGYLQFGLGSYQEPLRSSFNDVETYTDYRRQVEKQQQKIERGGGNPIGWNDRVLAQYQAALEVRQRIEQDVGIPIPYVIGQGESSLIHTAIKEDIDTEFITQTGHTTEKKLPSRIVEVDTEKTAETRELMSDITTTAREISGVEETNFFMVGPRMAIPQFPEIYNRACGEMDTMTDSWDLAEETRNILSHIDKEAVDGRSIRRIEAEADRLAEEHPISSQQDKERLINQLDAAYRLANHTRDIKALADSRQYSSAALLLAASIKMDPFYRYDANETYRQAIDLQHRLEPATATTAEIGQFRNRGDFRVGEEGTAWYHTTDQWR